ncbi:hypothetical protein CJ030_MR1G001038 [Morella rubra]|uniref:non-specific serine/threonine protein kinase n=1 Tax=Morella rubra TaxID=262757 RepID=A0A6A1WP73_9ROSI|nr:hypothetical protein CJ030_MR1G001038 [Morella rubra]
MGVLMVTIWCFKKKLSSNRIIYFWKQESLSNIAVETFLRSNGPLALRRYSYSDIKKMTNFFTEKLGQGGYGGVYKGKLPDGSLVAVKVLKESRGNGEEFINEVASISRTSHVNIVTLMGFCFEGSKRGLIYEFMPNGSLDKFIYKQNLNLRDDQRLEWEVLQDIAVGIARGLEYLHRGCNTRILHFDIKPHNILLDENLCPKISDFGLAKICPREESIISMLGARGTIGYIAPEVFCRNFGGVSHKSDVYSYGMMILEMVGGRKNIDAEADRTSEIFFPHWIYKRLELEEELGNLGIMNEKDRESARRMIVVSLWCIQTDPSNRPSMRRVIEMLEGTLESLQIPPKPFFSSPSRSPIDSASTTVRSLPNEDPVSIQQFAASCGIISNLHLSPYRSFDLRDPKFNMEARLSLSSVITLSFFLTIFPPCYCDGNDQQLLECSRPYNCGSLNNIPFPFWGDGRPQYCGHQVHELSCRDNQYLVMEFGEIKFRVLNISQLSYRMTIARLDLWDRSCPDSPEAFLNTTLNFSVFDYPSTVENLTLFYGCSVPLPPGIPFSNSFMCGSEASGEFNAYVLDDAPTLSNLSYLNEKCRSQIKVPILRSSNPAGGGPALQKALNDGFEVEYNDVLPLACKACVESGGACGVNSSTQNFVCFCRDQLAQDSICKRTAAAEDNHR